MRSAGERDEAELLELLRRAPERALELLGPMLDDAERRVLLELMLEQDEALSADLASGSERRAP